MLASVAMPTFVSSDGSGAIHRSQQQACNCGELLVSPMASRMYLEEAYVRRVHGLRDERTFGALVSVPKLKETRKALNECHWSERRQFFCEPPSSVPLLSELALQAVPECLLWTHLKSGPFPPMVDKPMTRSQMLQEMQLEARRARRELEMCPPAAPPSPQVDYGYDSDTMLSDVSFNENEGEESDGSSESMSY